MQSRLILVFVLGAIAGYAGRRTPATSPLAALAPTPVAVPVPAPTGELLGHVTDARDIGVGSLDPTTIDVAIETR